MTPSGWHEDAQSRDAGHDEMQAGVYRFMESKWQKRLEKTEYNKTAVYERAGIYFECPFYKDGRIVTFIDVCVTFAKLRDEKQLGGHKNIIFCYEIKPRIYSVGATIRQCRATKHAVLTGSFYRQNGQWGSSRDETPEVHVSPVVPYDDPKLDLLAEFWPMVATWNATTETCDWHRRSADR
jgi:hypothetical protein